MHNKWLEVCCDRGIVDVVATAHFTDPSVEEKFIRVLLQRWWRSCWHSGSTLRSGLGD